MTAFLDSEKSIASFYQDHPYLIAPELGDKASFAEQVIGRHRLDLLIRRSNGKHTIVEFKREPLKSDDLLQVIRYWKEWKRKYAMTVKHYLVGLRPRNDEEFVDIKCPKGFKIIFRTIRMMFRHSSVGVKKHEDMYGTKLETKEISSNYLFRAKGEDKI